MPLFQRLFGKKKLNRLADSFTMTNVNHAATLCDWVIRQSQSGSCVVVLCHFQSSFVDNQSALQDAGIEFEILATPLDEEAFLKHVNDQVPSVNLNGGKVILTMAPMLQSDPSLDGLTARKPGHSLPAAGPFSVIVTERYPMTICDDKLELFFQKTDANVSIGYLISFQDPLLNRLLGDRFISLLKQLGMGDNDLISSMMTNRQLARQLARATATIENEVLADSPQEWIELNLD